MSDIGSNTMTGRDSSSPPPPSPSRPAPPPIMSGPGASPPPGPMAGKSSSSPPPPSPSRPAASPIMSGPGASPPPGPMTGNNSSSTPPPSPSRPAASPIMSGPGASPPPGPTALPSSSSPAHETPAVAGPSSGQPVADTQSTVHQPSTLYLVPLSYNPVLNPSLEGREIYSDNQASSSSAAAPATSLASVTYPVNAPPSDGFNWHMYLQRRSKGCPVPRSYYRCTYPGCLVQRRIERDEQHQITTDLYRGVHTHPPPHTQTASHSSYSEQQNIPDQESRIEPPTDVGKPQTGVDRTSCDPK